MSKKLYEDSNIQSIANAIRSKLGGNETYLTSEMAAAIGQIHGEPVLEALVANENGVYAPSTGKDGFSGVTVSVPVSEPDLEELSVVQNGTYTPSTGKDGFSEVVVNVPSSGGGGSAPIISGTASSVILSGAQNIKITNYTYDIRDSIEIVYSKKSPSFNRVNYWPIFFSIKSLNEMYSASLTENRWGGRNVINALFGYPYSGYIYSGDSEFAIGNVIDSNNAVQIARMYPDLINDKLCFYYTQLSMYQDYSFISIATTITDSVIADKSLSTYAEATSMEGGYCYLFPATSNNDYFNNITFYSFIIRRNNEVIHEYIPFDNEGTLALQDLATNDIIETEIEISSSNYSDDNKFYPSCVHHEAVLIEKTVTENGTYDASDDEADGYSQVVVNAPVSVGGEENLFLPYIFYKAGGNSPAITSNNGVPCLYRTGDYSWAICSSDPVPSSADRLDITLEASRYSTNYPRYIRVIKFEDPSINTHTDICTILDSTQTVESILAQSQIINLNLSENDQIQKQTISIDISNINESFYVGIYFDVVTTYLYDIKFNVPFVGGFSGATIFHGYNEPENNIGTNGYIYVQKSTEGELKTDGAHSLKIVLSNWKLRKSDKIVLKYRKWGSYASSHDPGFLGDNETKNNAVNLLIQENRYSARNCINIRYNNAWSGDAGIAIPSPTYLDSTNDIKTIILDPSEMKFSFLVNDIEVKTNVLPGTYSDEETNTYPVLFPEGPGFQIALLNLKVYNKLGELIHDYYPAYNNNMYGVYDNIDEVYCIKSYNYPVEMYGKNTLIDAYIKKNNSWTKLLNNNVYIEDINITTSLPSATGEEF